MRWGCTFFTTVSLEYCDPRYYFVSIKESRAHIIKQWSKAPLTCSCNPYGLTYVEENLIPWPSFFHAWQSDSLKQNPRAQPFCFLMFVAVRLIDQGQMICLICWIILFWFWSPLPCLFFFSACVSHTFFRWFEVLRIDGTLLSDRQFLWYTWMIDLQFSITVIQDIRMYFSEFLRILRISEINYNCFATYMFDIDNCKK